MFSKKVQEAKVAYTFDDFLLTPNASYVEPKDIDTKIKLGLVELDNRNKYDNLLDKIELLFTQMDKLITEVKDINKNINNRR